MNYQYINDNYFAVYTRQGHDRNGNPIYLLNFFKRYESKLDTNKQTSNDVSINGFYNVNCRISAQRSDKYGNIKITSFNIYEDLQRLFNTMT